MTFGDALEALKAGHRVTRSSWNGSGYELYLIRPVGLYHFDSPYHWELAAWIGAYNDSKRLVPWTPSQDDMLCGDWEIIYVH